MLHTNEELKELQSYPLDMKEFLTAQRIREAAKEFDLYVSFSGGKDSEVAVDFVAKTLKRLGYSEMHVLNVRTGLEYLSVMNFCKPFCEYVSKKYDINVILETRTPKMKFTDVLKEKGYPVISKEVSKCIREARKGLKNADGTYQYRLDKLNGVYKNKDGSISQYNMSQYKFLLDAPFNISEQCCIETKEKPAILYEKETGRIPIIATTCEESRLRRTKWLQNGCNAFHCDRPTSKPFSFWTEQDMLKYIHDSNLPIAEAYGNVVPVNKTGISGQYNLFDVLDDYHECTLCTTGCPRTGCLFCLFGITQDPERILRLQELEPKRADFVLNGGEFNNDNMWVPTKDGLGYWFVLDWLTEHGIEVPYENKERYKISWEK